MTQDEIQRLRELVSEATQGEWKFSCDYVFTVDAKGFHTAIGHCVEVEDAAYIVAACNALPGLLDELDEAIGFIRELSQRDRNFYTSDMYGSGMAKSDRDVAKQSREVLRRIGVSE